MSPAAGAGSPPGPRSESPGTAELLCATTYGSGLAVAERIGHGTSTAFVGVQIGRVLGLEAADLAAVVIRSLADRRRLPRCSPGSSPITSCSPGSTTASPQWPRRTG